MEIDGKVPKTLVRLCQKDGRVKEVRNEGINNVTNTRNDYWLELKDGYNWEGCGSIHEPTIATCREALQAVIKGECY